MSNNKEWLDLINETAIGMLHRLDTMAIKCSHHTTTLFQALSTNNSESIKGSILDVNDELKKAGWDLLDEVIKGLK